MNADHGSTPKQRLMWMINAVSDFVSSLSVSLNAKVHKNLEVMSRFSFEYASPTRMYTENLIVNYISWSEIKNANHIPYICEFGCGDLRYLDLYDQILGKDKYRYIGIESSDFRLSEVAQSRLSSNIEFLNFDLNKGVPFQISQCNLFISFSVLEHIDDLDNFLKSYKEIIPFGSFHYHSVPTFLSVINYLWHGCRHFNKKDINGLLSGGNSYSPSVVFYGGLISIVSHLCFITSLELLNKVIKVNKSVRIKSDFIARCITSLLQSIDNLTVSLGIHSFSLVSWRTINSSSEDSEIDAA